MSHLEGVSTSASLDRLKDAAENFENIRRRIGPFMPVRVNTPIPPEGDWKRGDEHMETDIRQPK